MKSFRMMASFTVAAIFLFAGALPADKRESAETLLQRAYFLEQQKSDFYAAAPLYAQVAVAKDASREAKALAGERLAICREEIAVSDLARLMPPAPLAYVESHFSAERFCQLLDQLGLLARMDKPPVPGQNDLAISPALIEALGGLRGAALALTGLDDASGHATGVIIIHSSHLGIFETILPATAQVLQPIRGCPLYKSGDLFFAATRRLYLLASTQKEIAAALERLSGKESASLAADPQWSDMLKERQDDRLFFFMQTKLLGQLLKKAPGVGGFAGRSLLSLQALGGRLQYGTEGLRLDLLLQRKNESAPAAGGLPRPQALDREALRPVPADAALMFALHLPEPPTVEAALPSAKELPRPANLDYQQTLMSVVRSIVIYMLPPVSSGNTPAIPDIAALVMVRDAGKLQALEEKLLGLAAGEALPQIAGAAVRSYRISDKLTILSARVGERLYLASSESALKKALEGVPAGQSLADDKEFAASLSRFTPDTLMALFARAGSCLAAARPFVPLATAVKLEPFAGLMSHTSIAITAEWTGRMLKLSTMLFGLPDVSAPLNQMLTQKQRQQSQMQEALSGVQGGQSTQALLLLAQQLAQKSDSANSLKKIFDLLAVKKRDPASAATVADFFAKVSWNDAQALNRFAWNLLTEEKYGKRYNDIALRLSRRANELTNQQRWGFLDTLALAEFESGHVRQAVKIEQQAADLLAAKGGDDGLADILKTLKRFRAALPKQPRRSPSKTP